MRISNETTSWYYQEVCQLYKDRMNDTELGQRLIKNGLLQNFEQALINFHKFCKNEQEEVLWCLRHAVIDASDTLVLEELIKDGRYKGNLEDGYPDSTSFSDIIEGEENLLVMELRTIIPFSISFTQNQFKDLSLLREKLEANFRV